MAAQEPPWIDQVGHLVSQIVGVKGVYLLAGNVSVQQAVCLVEAEINVSGVVALVDEWKSNKRLGLPTLLRILPQPTPVFVSEHTPDLVTQLAVLDPTGQTVSLIVVPSSYDFPSLLALGAAMRPGGIVPMLLRQSADRIRCWDGSSWRSVTEAPWAARVAGLIDAILTDTSEGAVSRRVELLAYNLRDLAVFIPQPVAASKLLQLSQKVDAEIGRGINFSELLYMFRRLATGTAAVLADHL